MQSQSSIRLLPPSWNSESPTFPHALYPRAGLSTTATSVLPLLSCRFAVVVLILLIAPLLSLILRAIRLIIFTPRVFCWDSSIVFRIEYFYLFVVMNAVPSHPYHLVPFSLSLSACHRNRLLIGLSPPSPHLIVCTVATATPYCRFWVYFFPSIAIKHLCPL